MNSGKTEKKPAYMKYGLQAHGLWLQPIKYYIQKREIVLCEKFLILKHILKYEA